MAESLFNKVYNPDVLHDFVNASDCFTGVEIKRSIQKGAYRWKNSFSGYGYGYRALAIYNIMGKHLDTAEFKVKKIVERAHGIASDIIAEADHNAERKVKIAQIHADGILSQAEQTATKATQQAQEYLDGIVQSIEAERSKPTPKRKRQAEEEIALLRTENAALRQLKAIADRDRSDLFEQLQKAERRAKGKEQAFGMVSDMLAAYPAEFDALLNKSRAKNSAPPFKANSNDRGGK